jgi:hypothetical protein
MGEMVPYNLGRLGEGLRWWVMQRWIDKTLGGFTGLVVIVVLVRGDLSFLHGSVVALPGESIDIRGDVLIIVILLVHFICGLGLVRVGVYDVFGSRCIMRTNQLLARGSIVSKRRMCAWLNVSRQGTCCAVRILTCASGR